MSSTIPLPPREQLYNRYCSNKHTHLYSPLTFSLCPPIHPYLHKSPPTLSKNFIQKISFNKIELQNQLRTLKEYQLLRGLRDGATTHPRRRPRTNDAYPILIRTEMRRIHRVAVLSDARFAPIDPLRHPPQSVSVHSRNDSGDTGGRCQESVCCLLVLNSVTSTPQWIRQPEAAWGPVMDRLVAELGGGGNVTSFHVLLLMTCVMYNMQGKSYKQKI
jgi:hypothetical protein